MKKITALAALLAIPALAAPAGYFQVPGTDTTLKLYGKIQLREAYGLNGNGMSDVAFGPSGNGELPGALGTHNEDWQQSGQWSGSWRYYMGVTTTTPSSFGDIKTVIYGRFKHNDVSQADGGKVSGQSINFNLEQAYVQIGGLKLGTDWSLFGYGAWEPNTLFGCVADEDGTWTNTRQISYVGSPVQGLDLGIALESPSNSDNSAAKVKSNGTTAAAKYPDSNGTYPTIVAVAAYTADWGGVTAGINYQQKKDWTKGGVNASGNGTSFTLSGGWNITKADQLTLFVLKGGETYGSGQDGFYADGNDYSFYKSTAIALSYTHTWNDQFSSALTVAQTKWPKDVTAQTALGQLPDDYKCNEYIVNTTWQMTKTVSLGVEYQHTEMKASDNRPWIDDGNHATDKNKLDMFRFKLQATLF